MALLVSSQVTLSPGSAFNKEMVCEKLYDLSLLLGVQVLCSWYFSYLASARLKLCSKSESLFSLTRKKISYTMFAGK